MKKYPIIMSLLFILFSCKDNNIEQLKIKQETLNSLSEKYMKSTDSIESKRLLERMHKYEAQIDSLLKVIDKNK